MGYVSPFARSFKKLPIVEGVRLSAASTGMRYKGRDDIFLVELGEKTQIAGVFTRNTMCGAPVTWNRSIIDSGKARALVVNAGIANVFTGDVGKKISESTAEKTAELLGCAKEEVFIGSTGIIGEQIDFDKLSAKLPKLAETLSEDNWGAAAKAFMTTDTFPKGVTRQAFIGGAEVTINGIIKGSGMIEPNMATMLGYIFTDASIPAFVLQELLSRDTEKTYNCMTVDSDTSTSDMVLLFATGERDHWEVTDPDSPELQDFREKLLEVHTELAQLIARDGEGITKFVTVNIKGGKSFESARSIGKSIANSPLVKTAIAGSDPNWGRIVAAIGKSGEDAVMERTSIWIGDILVAENGILHPDYVEANAAKHMQGDEIIITVDVGAGSSDATIWTSDLTHEYITINTDYRN